jgi:hypothetical protein
MDEKKAPDPKVEGSRAESRGERGPAYCYAKMEKGKAVPLKKGEAPTPAGTWVRTS